MLASPSSEPAFTSQPAFGAGPSGLPSVRAGSGVHRSPLVPPSTPPPVSFAPLDASAGAAEQRQTLRGPHFSVPPPSPRISFDLGGGKELNRERLLSAVVLVVFGLATAAAAVFAYQEHLERPSVPTLPPAAVAPPLAAPTPVALTPPTPVEPPASPDEPKEVSAAVAPEATQGASDAGSPGEAPPKDASVEELAPLERVGPSTEPALTAPKAVEPKPLDPRDAKRAFDGLLERADRLRERERPDLAMDLYGKAHELRPERVEPVAGRGLALLDMRKYAPAQGVFLQALRLNERYGPAIMGLAEVYRLEGNNPKAIEQYQRYLDVLPEGAEAAVARNNIQRLKP